MGGPFFILTCSCALVQVARTEKAPVNLWWPWHTCSALWGPLKLLADVVTTATAPLCFVLFWFPCSSWCACGGMAAAEATVPPANFWRLWPPRSPFVERGASLVSAGKSSSPIQVHDAPRIENSCQVCTNSWTIGVSSGCGKNCHIEGPLSCGVDRPTWHIKGTEIVCLGPSRATNLDPA